MDNRNIKIAIIIQSLDQGGSERQVLNLASYLSDNKYQADIISINNRNEYKEEYRNELKTIKVKCLSRVFQSSLLCLKIFESICIFLQIHAKNSYQTFLAFDIHSYYYALIAKLLFRKPIIIGVQNNIPKKLDEYSIFVRLIHNNILRLCLTIADKIVCPSYGTAFELQHTYNISSKKIDVIPNAINLMHIDLNVKKTKKLPSFINKRKSKILIACGRLVPQKNFSTLIEIFYHLKKRQKNAKLIILGSGPLKEDLLGIIKRLSLQNNVFIIDFTSYPYQFFRKADLFISTSAYEGFQNVLIEAMASRLPVVSSDCPYGPREILSGKKIYYPISPVTKTVFEKYGVLIPMKTNKYQNIAIAQDLYKLLQNTKLLKQYRDIGRSRSMIYSISKIGSAYLKSIYSIN